jgi:hypothetical protein
MVHLFFKYLLVLAVMFHVNHFLGQTDSVSDPTASRRFFPSQYGDDKWKFLGAVDQRHSAHKGRDLSFIGLRLGAKYKGVHRFGLGYYELNPRNFIKNSPVEGFQLNDSAGLAFRAQYLSLFYERVIFRSPRWEFSLPFEIARGQLSGNMFHGKTLVGEIEPTPFNAFGATFQTKFYLVKWFAVRVSIGYRQLFNVPAEISQIFSHTTYSYGAQISLVDAYEAIFKRKKTDVKEK